ncbi:MAG: zinc-dependent metalloprotease [Elainellaceae cyanobacterium]
MTRWKFGILLALGFILASGVAIARPAIPAWGQTLHFFSTQFHEISTFPEISHETSNRVPKEAVESTIHQTSGDRKVAQSSAQNSAVNLKPDATSALAPSLRPGALAANPSASFDSLIQQSEQLPGLFTIYRHRDTETLYLALQPEQFNQNYLCLMTLSSGLGEIFYRGWSLGDFLFQFQRVRDTVQLVIPNIYFRTQLNDPQQRSIDRSFSDSAIATLPLVATDSATGAVLLDLSNLVLQGRDLANLSSIVGLVFGGSYSLNADSSYIQDVKAFPDNVELDTVYSFSGTNVPFSLNSLPDQRAFNLGVHYSFSKLPTTTTYRPRLADERVGYFINAYQDLSQMNRVEPFVRYIWRWGLEKQQPDLSPSPPQEPIVFWIENTVPEEYRDAIRQGVLLWNKAFAEAGFEDALEVRQMPAQADWDPADVRYNTIRWTTSLYPFGAVGIPRVNPLTGQILDADVVIDAGFIRFMRDTSGFLAQQQSQSGANRSFPNAQLLNPQFCNPTLSEPYLRWTEYQNQGRLGNVAQWQAIAAEMGSEDGCYGMGLASHGAMGALTLTTLNNALPSGDAMETLVQQFLTHLTAHEVGHALGLRHNFRASTMLAPEELNDRTITQERGLTGSVMDYTPVNLAPAGTEQGDYFSTTIGEYDTWAIAYGYTPTDALLPIQEQRELDAIARRAPELGLTYATDEDAYDPLNPSANFWDLSSNPLQYAQWQMDNAKAVWEKLPNRYPIAGESYSELRDRFDVVYNYFFGQVFKVTRYVGGQVFNRDRRGDPGGRQPFELVPLAQQRQALQVLDDYVFSSEAFNFPPNLVSRLAPSRWWHWGSTPAMVRLDYPVYDSILWMQSLTLTQLLSAERLSRIRDAELSYAADQVLSLPELFETLKTDIWSELFTDESPDISSLRRGLQRQHLKILSNMALRNTSALDEATNFMDAVIAFETLDAPEDARVLASYQLRQLGDVLSDTLRRYDDDLDLLTLAHLQDALDRINKVANAPLRSR